MYMNATITDLKRKKIRFQLGFELGAIESSLMFLYHIATGTLTVSRRVELVFKL